MSRRNFLAVTCAAVACATIGSQAIAQTQSRILLGFAPGGAGDTLARIVAQHLSRALGASLHVENRPGAAGRIAVDAVRMAEPDGATLLNSPSSLLTLTPHAFRSGNYNPLRDLAPVATLAELDFALVVGPSMPVRTMAEFIQFCRSNPRMASYGTAGAGTPQHMIGALLAQAAGIELTHVAYRGGSPALQDVLGGTLPACIASLSDLMITASRDGRIRILATSGARRSAFLPTTPVLAEEGLAVTASDWTGLLAPVKTPAPVLARWESHVVDMVRGSEFKAALARFNMEPLVMGAKAYRERLEAEYAAWGPVVKASGFNLDS